MKKYITMEELNGLVRNWDGKLYKVFKDGHKPTNGKEYAWSLPEGDTPGKWTAVETDPVMCEKGWHLTTHYAHWLPYSKGIVYEAESDSIVEFDGYDKIVCERVRLLRRIEFHADKNKNSGDCNSGSGNSGDCNSGSWNSGNQNSGSDNSGSGNSGARNSGSWNSGNLNSGARNSGSGNSGNRNSGDCNSGSGNSGNRNSGDCNSGSGNSGNRNSGSGNSGNWNACSGPYLHLCDKPVKYLFNKPVDAWPKFPAWFYFVTCWKESFEKAADEELEQAIGLPNFDFAIFERISGISKEDFETRLGRKL